MCNLAIPISRKNIRIKADVVQCDIPLLLSKASMKRAGTIVVMTADTLTVFGSAVPLSSTSIGHYILPIFRAPTESAVNQMLWNCSLDSPKSMVLKLHRQLAHPTSEKLTKLLKHANRTSKEYLEAVDKVTESCKICIKFKRARPRPVVSMPLASTFNETVYKNFEIFQGVYFLVIVDLATRYCFSDSVKE